ncbi:hypothetical protein RFI_24661 [Reticulomyxa filosa]|uniref:SAC3/GANP/THP3 conserved domain-containing protein n=1 Tax=Reticulomyxa filosa TaxID=46433 RepID=X6MH09_RETFI|nr:hypothetical protein RFI_24661 [Reticulomyxa filosa]|eukprot:ETO12717.1 hypothetical protein RFI_24661 [Reticulomyxa filosa]
MELYHKYEKKQVKSEQTKATCYLMCPSGEVRNRIKHDKVYKPFEDRGNELSFVKEYVKSNAGQVVSMPDVRPLEVLLICMQYLMNIVLNKTKVPYVIRYNYLEDRIRSAVKDLYMQHGSGDLRLSLLEICVRFRICSHFLLCECDETLTNKHFFSSALCNEYTSTFLGSNQYDDKDSSDVTYSEYLNIKHVPNILSNLVMSYRGKYSNTQDISLVPFVVIHVVALQVLVELRKYPKSAHMALNILFSMPQLFREHQHLVLIHSLLLSYERINLKKFFELYKLLTPVEQCILYFVIDALRLRWIAVCGDIVRNTSITSFIHMMGFENKLDLQIFITAYYGDVDLKQMESANGSKSFERMIKAMQTRIKTKKLMQRFPCKDYLLRRIDTISLQKIVQENTYQVFEENTFYNAFQQLDSHNSLVPSVVNPFITPSIDKHYVVPTPIRSYSNSELPKEALQTSSGPFFFICLFLLFDIHTRTHHLYLCFLWDNFIND